MLQSFYKKETLEAGCDEAGRGCLAGPVCAAAVILPPGFLHQGLNDSKKLSKKDRDTLRIVIEEQALAWNVAFVSPKEIDEINILNASFEAMHRAIKGLGAIPEFLLIDGNRFKDYPGINHKCIVGGDAKFLSIAAASILAKTHRDEYMLDQSRAFEHYHWDQNKGYPTKKHREAILQHGPTPLHRMSFRLYPNYEQGKLF